MRSPLRRHAAVTLAVLSCWAPGAPGRAQRPEPRPRVLVLDIQPRAVPPALAREVTDLVRRAVGANPRFQLAPPPALRLRAMLLALGCARLDAACLGRIGRQLGVARIFHGEVGRTAHGTLVRFHLFDVKGGEDRRSFEHEVADADGRPALRAGVADAAAVALGAPLSLAVSASVEGAIVLVNGQPVGTTPITVTDGLRIGTNEVLVRARGRKDFSARVSLRPGRPMSVRAVLPKGGATLGRPPGPALVTPVPGPSRGGEKGVRPVYKRWWFWAIIGAVVAGSTTAGYLATRGGGSPAVGVEF